MTGGDDRGRAARVPGQGPLDSDALRSGAERGERDGDGGAVGPDFGEGDDAEPRGAVGWRGDAQGAEGDGFAVGTLDGGTSPVFGAGVELVAAEFLRTGGVDGAFFAPLDVRLVEFEEDSGEVRVGAEVRDVDHEGLVGERDERGEEGRDGAGERGRAEGEDDGIGRGAGGRRGDEGGGVGRGGREAGERERLLAGRGPNGRGRCPRTPGESAGDRS